MKVLFINSVCGIRSTGRIVTDLAQMYLAQGHQCRIAYGREAVPEKWRSCSYRIGNELGVKVNGLKARILDNEGLNGARATKAFLNWATEYDPDVLWLHNLHGYYLNIELLFAWIKQRPHMQVKWTLHDCWAFTGHCAHFSYARCSRWKNGCESCPQLAEYPKSLGRDGSKENYARKKAAFTGVPSMTLVVPSNWLAGLVRESFLGEYPVEVVHNRIDLQQFCPRESDFRREHGLQEKFIILGVASAWSEKKGLGDFVKLAKLVDGACKIVLVGLEQKQIREMPGEILCIPRTNSPRQLAEIYTAADVFVNLTYEDTYPTVNLEAQACGTPCITYRTGGSVESVPEDCVVEQGDLPGLLEKLKALRARKNL